MYIGPNGVVILLLQLAYLLVSLAYFISLVVRVYFVF